MKKDVKFLTGYEHICLYCGNDIEQRYEEYEAYYECNCEDAKKVREIKEKIKQLERTLPKYKFKAVKKDILIKVSSYEY